MDHGFIALIDQSVNERILDYEFAQIVHPFVREHCASDTIRANLGTELEADIRKGTDAGLAKGFREHCPVDGASENDYMIRHVQLATGLDLLTGIRFRGLDLNRPFVAILHRSKGFADGSQLRQAMDQLTQEFAIFSPKAVLFYCSSASDEYIPDADTADKRILMGAIDDIASIPIDPSLTIKKATELDFYDQYRDEYAIVEKNAPDYLRAETAESEEDMRDCVEKHITYKVYMGGEFAGVFVVTKSTFLGADGYYVIENLLFEKFRGRKLADSLQSAVARELSALGGKLLFGSIYPSNFPSYRAAIRSRRVDIGGNYMVSISG